MSSGTVLRRRHCHNVAPTLAKPWRTRPDRSRPTAVSLSMTALRTDSSAPGRRRAIHHYPGEMATEVPPDWATAARGPVRSLFRLRRTRPGSRILPREGPVTAEICLIIRRGGRRNLPPPPFRVSAAPPPNRSGPVRGMSHIPGLPPGPATSADLPRRQAAASISAERPMVPLQRPVPAPQRGSAPGLTVTHSFAVSAVRHSRRTTVAGMPRHQRLRPGWGRICGPGQRRLHVRTHRRLPGWPR